MAGRAGDMVDLRERLERSFEAWREPGAQELCELMQEMLRDHVESGHPIRFEQLKNEVFRLRPGGEPGRTLVLKRLRPAVAQTDRMVAECWLPALGLGDRSPRLLGVAAARDGRWVWHVYEDLGLDSLAVRCEPERLAAAVE